MLFEQPENRLVFDAAWLSRTAELGNAVTHAAVLSLCDELLDEFQLSAGIAGKVRNALLANSAASTNFAAVGCPISDHVSAHVAATIAGE